MALAIYSFTEWKQIGKLLITLCCRTSFFLFFLEMSDSVIGGGREEEEGLWPSRPFGQGRIYCTVSARFRVKINSRVLFSRWHLQCGQCMSLWPSSSSQQMCFQGENNEWTSEKYNETFCAATCSVLRDKFPFYFHNVLNLIESVYFFYKWLI